MTDAIVENVLHDIAAPLADFLGLYLPKLGDDWWYSRVCPFIPSFIQDRTLKDNLHTLDTAALLKVFSKNWDELKTLARLDFIQLNYLREAQTIRNTWAHQSANEQISEDIIDRHLDTLCRLCQGIDASPELIKKIKQARIDYFMSVNGCQRNHETSLNTSPETIKPEVKEISKETSSQIKLVRLISKPELIGTVIDVSTTGKEPRYSVFINGKIQQWYQSQIEEVSISDEIKPVSLKEFEAHITARQLQNPNSKSLFSLNSAKISIIPHQFRPVLKFIKADRPRLLIADGVGVGKTIEAGLILKELEARNDIQNVLIICPKPLVSERKWQDEMKTKFGESFTALDSGAFKHAIDEAFLNEEWDMRNYGKIIVPYSILLNRNTGKTKLRKGLFDLPEPPKFDLVIVDEAHHIKNSNTQGYDAVKYFVENADAAILLTATPIQTGNEDLFTLLNLLRPDILPDMQTFNMLSEPNPFINQAISELRSQKSGWEKRAKNQLMYALTTDYGRAIYPKNPVFASILNLLDKPDLSDEDRVSLLSDIETLHTFSAILNRTRRRDIDSCYATRKTTTVRSEFTVEQKKVYDEVIRIQAEILNILQPETPAAFMIKTIQRRAASCLLGLVPYLKDILTKHILHEDYLESEWYNEEELKLDSLLPQIEKLLKLAESLPKDDLKYDMLCEILREKQTQEQNKVMLFSTFRHTLNYLAEKLTADNFRVGLIHGDVKDEDRLYLRSRFKLPKENPDALDILLFSEVGGEGLDYQFCDCMVNYDLPWNPMKIEQRIGRIDRTGQKSQKVSIFNMITPETVDAEIYDRCLARIGIFEESIGGSEVILGKIAEAIEEIGDNFHLTDAEKAERLSQLADNKIREYKINQELSEKQNEFFGLALPTQQMTKEFEDAKSFWLSPESLENLLKVYFKKRFSSDSDFIIGSSSLKKLRLNAEYRAQIKADSKQFLDKAGYASWKRWLDGKDKDKSPYYSIFFDAQSASEHDGDLLTPAHPLIKLAVSYITSADEIITSIKVKDDTIKTGKYPFAVYMWEYSGVLKNQKMVAVSENESVSAKIFDFIKKGADCESTESIDDDTKELFENKLYELWKNELEIHKSKTHNALDARMASLNQSYQARLAALDDSINKASDFNIKRMKTEEKNNVLTELENKLGELKESEKTTDIEKSLIGYGIVEVE